MKRPTEPNPGQGQPGAPAPPTWKRPLPRCAERARLDAADSGVMAMIDHCSTNERWPLYLHGSTGVGKTCAAAVGYSLWQPSATWFSLLELSDILHAFASFPMQRVRFGGRMQEMTLGGFWERMRRVGLVVIDEIGPREMTAQRSDALLRVLETRHNRPLIVTGNLTPIDGLVKAYGERIQSRFAAGVMVAVQGRDRRLDHISSTFWTAGGDPLEDQP